MMQHDVKSATHGRHFLRRSDAATYITQRYGFPCSRQWLAKLAVIGGGPLFRRAGHIQSMSRANWIGGRKRASGRRSGRLRKSIRRDLMVRNIPIPSSSSSIGIIRWGTSRMTSTTSATSSTSDKPFELLVHAGVPHLVGEAA
jgi:hypothetical protein